MNNKIVARSVLVGMLLFALIFGGVMYYTQVYAYYETLAPEDVGPVMLVKVDGTAAELPVTGMRAIDSDSSPLRFRACFSASAPPAEISASFARYEGASPLVGPSWFDCFDAREVGEALESGVAQAYLWQENIHYGIDRVVAIMPDGRAFAWQQMNHCGEVVYDGEAAPEGCPPAPEV
ncbi:hypothetical protein BVG79_01668 [Ketogulonicigenium robustum]|uniref:Histidine kinase n=1 Tax=Ketogulonicigenium robustum TaxID=92947 RepID=A0A1W6P0H3_9RHOB|nr:DUF6446 family protein [Ketogulonicigenium robustum]ARO15012.1 hypothetical protein BVG79_01668 [Ketogulonicigenium robustum]